MLSAGMLTDLASAMIVRSRGLLSASPPPFLAATVSSLMMRVKILPRLASAAPFLCLIVCHLEWPDMAETPGKAKENDSGCYHGRTLSGAAQQDPGVGPRIPWSAPIVAEHGVHREPGALETPRHRGDRQGAERQREIVDAAIASPRRRIALIEDREAARTILTD